MIHVKHLWHSYTGDDQFALRDISFDVQKGEIFGFLGPSGSGKSTTQNIITGLLPLQKGEVRAAGYDMAKPQLGMYNEIGVCFEQANLYAKMSALENLRYFAGLFDVPTEDPMALIRMVGLADHARQRCGEYSKGMRQRINFARSMLNNPKLWFLDEPTSGLDPAIAGEIKQIILRRREAGSTVFLTTHNMYIAEDLCDRVAFIVDGQIKLIDSPRELKLRYGQQLADVEYLKDGRPESLSLKLDEPEDRAKLRQIIDEHPIRRLHTREATLEQIFIQITGKELMQHEADAQHPA